MACIFHFAIFRKLNYRFIFMRRDTIFYRLFQQSPTLLLELLPLPPTNPGEYIFASVEVKETSFRLDGVFMPPNPTGIVYFCEVQFQKDELLYERMLSEISIYTYRHRNLLSDWRAVAIYPSRSVEQSQLSIVQEMLESGRIVRIYLDELAQGEELPTGLSLMVLTTLEGDVAIRSAREMISQSLSIQGGNAIIDLVSTIMVYKFNNLTRDEVNAMLGIEFQQTRVYQEAKAEGRTEGERALAVRLLTRKLGNLSPEITARVNSLSIERLESLGEVLLDFTSMADLENFLASSNS
jgi:predicted transposase/invertase (TIGR01784 family)